MSAAGARQRAMLRRAGNATSAVVPTDAATVCTEMNVRALQVHLSAQRSPGSQPARDVGARSADSSGGGCSWATTSGALDPVASIDFFTVAP